MRFKCLACGKEFMYAAKVLHDWLANEPVDPRYSTHLEKHVCPYCQSLNIDEVVEASEPERQVEAVEHESWEAKKDKNGVILSGGTARINALLKQGYVIVEKFTGVKSVVLYKYVEPEPKRESYRDYGDKVMAVVNASKNGEAKEE